MRSEEAAQSGGPEEGPGPGAGAAVAERTAKRRGARRAKSGDGGKFCIHCGAEIPGAARFCIMCGRPQ
ncbi:MAG: zinc ribbon domain-containing protein [Candidatus Bathyarchaeia archaeon]